MLGFVNFYSWLKYASTPASYIFRNRLFLEKAFRSNNIYPFLGETHKSFSWMPLSSPNTSIYWFKSSYLRLLFILSLLLVPLYFYLNTGWLLSNQPLTYVIWRALDIFYLFIVQIQYVFLTTVVYAVFTLSNLIASTNFSFVRWMRKNHAEVSLTSSESAKAHSTWVTTPILDNTLVTMKHFAPGRVGSALPTNNMLFFKYLYGLITFIMGGAEMDRDLEGLGGFSDGITDKYKVSREQSVFSLSSLVCNRNVNITSLDYLQKVPATRCLFESLLSNFTHFLKISRWTSLYCASPEKLIRLGAPQLTTLPAVNFYVNREMVQQSLFGIRKIPALTLSKQAEPLSEHFVAPHRPAPLQFYTGLAKLSGSYITSNVVKPLNTSLKTNFTSLPKSSFFISSRLVSGSLFYSESPSIYKLSAPRQSGNCLKRWL